jgi:predicted DNA-binding ArsR family transcriptional regulator
LLTESKNVHLEHLEDLIFNKGYAGAEEALDYLESLRHMLAEGTGTTTQLTVKWDGSPAIICGIDPEDSKFFCGYQSSVQQG